MCEHVYKIVYPLGTNTRARMNIFIDITEADPTKEQIMMYTKRLRVPYTSATLNKERTVNIVVP